jgi:hypothetical protein
MTYFYRSVFTFLFIGTLLNTAFAQRDNEILINSDFSAKNFKQIVQELEQKTDYKFYFNPIQLDSFRVDLVAKDKSVPAILEELFANTDIRYVIDASKHVYLIQGRDIQASLPEDFFDRESKGDGTYNKALLDYLDNEKKGKSKILAESKLYEIGKKTSTIGTGNAIIAGHIRNAESGEVLIGASIYIEKPLIGAATDQFGYFMLTIPKGRHELVIKSIGMKTSKRQIILYSDGKLDVELQEDVTSLKEVIVESEKDKNISGMQMGLDRLDIKTMKKIPVALGEVDVMKVMLTLPGVQTVGEGASGLNVRGGATNQNLILFNDAVIYNPSHLFGFFSAFNPDVIKSVELYKSGIPAEYGGRLSSVMDVNSHEGNKKKFKGAGGIGPITGRLTLEGPIIKDKTSFLIGARSTYSDWLLKRIPSDALKNSAASFFDINTSISHQVNEKNNIYLTGYYSKDRFKLGSDTVYNYVNKSATLKWKHVFGNKLYGVLTGSYSGYDYEVKSEKNPIEAKSLQYTIDQSNVKADFSYYPIPKHSLNFGASVINYALSPGTITPIGSASEATPDQLNKERALESALYIGDNFEVSSNLSLYFGIRYSLFNFLGPNQIYTYEPGQSKSETTLADSISYTSGKNIKTYQGPEYRFSAKYLLSDNTSLKFSYNRTRQYLQMLSNTTAISPTDTWKLSDPHVGPQIGDQISLGLYKNLRSSTIETSVEVYYKAMQNTLDYKGGAELLMNHNIEQDIINARGKAYGIELMIKRMAGKVNGWISYAYSRSLIQSKSNFDSENINNGKYYPSNYDKPHAVNLIGNYRFSHRFSTSVNATYSTGRPYTKPIALYEIDGAERVLYGERNGDRIPDYFRMDLSINIEGNHKVRKLAHSSWSIGVYNLTGRRNAYSVFFETKDGEIKGYQLSVFGSPIPTITYNFRF